MPQRLAKIKVFMGEDMSITLQMLEPVTLEVGDLVKIVPNIEGRALEVLVIKPSPPQIESIE